MNGSPNRATRRGKTFRRAGTSLLAGTAAAAMAFGLAPNPVANAAIPVNLDLDPVYTAGTLASLLNVIGNQFPGQTLGGVYNSGPPQSVGGSIWLPYTVTLPSPINKDLSLTLDINAALYLQNTKRTSTQGLYNTLMSIPQPSTNTGCGGKTISGSSVVDSNPATSCRFSAMLATSEATLNLANAYRAQIANLQDPADIAAGYLKFPTAPGSTSALPTETNQLLAFLQNPLRPNGGFLSRFPNLSQLIGQDPSMPGAGLYKSTDGKTTLNTTTVDATWAYDPNADFPVIGNIFSILNSLDAFLPLNLTGGIGGAVLANSSGGTAKVDDIGLGLAQLFQIGVTQVPIPPDTPVYGVLSNGFYLPMAPGVAYYATIVPKQLPILSYMRLPSLVINAALSALNAPFRVGTPWSDALAPAMKILVNTGYDDVIAPDELNTVDPNGNGQTYAEEGYQAYDRTFTKSGTVTPFGSVNPLTAAERAQVPGDVWAALFSGLQQTLSKPFLGYIVPASSASSAAAKSPTAAARTAAPAAAEAATTPTETPAADIEDSAPKVEAPQAPSVTREALPTSSVASSRADRGRHDRASKAPSAAASSGAKHSVTR